MWSIGSSKWSRIHCYLAYSILPSPRRTFSISTCRRPFDYCEHVYHKFLTSDDSIKRYRSAFVLLHQGSSDLQFFAYAPEEKDHHKRQNQAKRKEIEEVVVCNNCVSEISGSKHFVSMDMRVPQYELLRPGRKPLDHEEAAGKRYIEVL